MYFPPGLYHRFVRPQWFTKIYIHDHIQSRFALKNKIVLDFGCGTGANCCMCDATHYYGIDPDAHRIRYAKRLYPNHTFMIFDKSQIPLPDQSVDLILIVAVLHHISNEQIADYLHEFSRVLKPDGRIIAIEPYLGQTGKLNNWFMTRYDDGKYIRHEDDYLRLFRSERYECHVLKRFRKCLLYNEIFFTAAPARNSMSMGRPPVETFVHAGDKAIGVPAAAAQMKTCVASLKSARESLDRVALAAQNQEAKAFFASAAEQAEQIARQVETLGH